MTGKQYILAIIIIISHFQDLWLVPKPFQGHEKENLVIHEMCFC